MIHMRAKWHVREGEGNVSSKKDMFFKFIRGRSPHWMNVFLVLETARL